MLLQLLIRQAEEAIAAKPPVESILTQAQKVVAEHLRSRQTLKLNSWPSNCLYRPEPCSVN